MIDVRESDIQLQLQQGWDLLLASGLTPHHLMTFHSRYKYLVMAHDPNAYRQLGRLLSDLKDADINLLSQRYLEQLTKALALPATRGAHANVLYHLAGYLRHQITDKDRREIHHCISEFSLGLVPLTSPMTLLKQYFAIHPNAYIAMQVYLQCKTHPLKESNCDHAEGKS